MTAKGKCCVKNNYFFVGHIEDESSHTRIRCYCRPQSMRRGSGKKFMIVSEACNDVRLRVFLKDKRLVHGNGNKKKKKLSIQQNAYLKVKDIFLARKSIYLHVHCRQCGFLGIRFPPDYFILFYCVFVMRKVLSDSVNKIFVSFVV